jgi:hypothetical protein
MITCQEIIQPSAKVEWCFYSSSVPLLNVSMGVNEEEAFKYKTEANIYV